MLHLLKKKKNKRVPKFKVGDWVIVRSAKEISQLLDPQNKQDGCLFMEQMWEYCGQKFEIMKVVNHVFDENKCEMFKTRIPLYHLDKLICNGILINEEVKCDRCCFLLWHESWLLPS